MSDQLNTIIASTQDLLTRWSTHMHELQSCGQVDTTEWDWPPLLVIDDGSDLPIEQKTIAVDQFMNAPQGKALLFEKVLPKLIVDEGIKRVVFAATAWAAVANADELEHDGTPVSKRPDRNEIVFLLAVEPDTVVGLVSPVNRKIDHAPTLGSWDTPAPDAGAEWSGALLDPVREALALTQGKGGDAHDSE